QGRRLRRPCLEWFLRWWAVIDGGPIGFDGCTGYGAVGRNGLTVRRRTAGSPEIKSDTNHVEKARYPDAVSRPRPIPRPLCRRVFDCSGEWDIRCLHSLHLDGTRVFLEIPMRMLSMDLSVIRVGNATAFRIEDVMPIATGHEREELEAALKGKNLQEIDYPEGPFGTKDSLASFQNVTLSRFLYNSIQGCIENFDLDRRNLVSNMFSLDLMGCRSLLLDEAPAVIQSYYDKRIVGCPGVEGEDEHDVVWFWLEKGKPHECPVCSHWMWWAQVDLQTVDMKMMRTIITSYKQGVDSAGGRSPQM
ncbi:cytochrome c oxidase family protein-like, partial [Striga asiatica]